jgi:hypothetical protein
MPRKKIVTVALSLNPSECSNLLKFNAFTTVVEPIEYGNRSAEFFPQHAVTSCLKS